MVHTPSLEIWEWGLKIFASAPTLTTHVDHLLLLSTQLICTNLEHKPLYHVGWLVVSCKIVTFIFSKLMRLTN